MEGHPEHLVSEEEKTRVDAPGPRDLRQWLDLVEAAGEDVDVQRQTWSTGLDGTPPHVVTLDE